MEKHPVILVVDDEDPMRKLFRANLSLEGYQVITTSDGISVLDILEEIKPDLILLDSMMPGLDGFHVLESIREHYNIPVIMLTSMCDQESLENTLKTCADDYVRKPFHTQILLIHIRAKLRRAELQASQN
jgi:two-component system, OmpR family, response regulator VicR